MNIQYYLIFCMKQFLFQRAWTSRQNLLSNGQSCKYILRNLGIGTALMRDMLELLKNKGYKKTSLSVQKANYAVRMYQKVGFEVIDENEEEYIMVCRL